MKVEKSIQRETWERAKMKRTGLALLVLLSTVLYSSGQDEPLSIGDRPVIPGVRVSARVGKFCPREAPLRIDCNRDGVDDLVFPSYHVGVLKNYISPENAANKALWWGLPGLLVGGLKSMNLVFDNRNFRDAGAVDGKNHHLLWSFQTEAMIEHFAFLPEKNLLFLASHDHHVYALEPTTGRKVWEQDLRAKVLALAVSEKDVIAVTAKNSVLAYSIDDGSTVWQQPVKTAVMWPGFGVMLDDSDSVYISSLDNYVHAFDRHSGEQRWTYQSSGNPSLKLLTKGVLVVAVKKEVVGLDPASGVVLWSFDAGGRVQFHPVVVLDGTWLFLSGRRGAKGRILAFDPSQRRLRWSVRLGKWPVGKERKVHAPEDTSLLATSLIVQRGTDGKAEIVYAADKRSVHAIRAEDGKVLWSAPSPETQTLALAGDRIVAADKKRVIRCLSPKDGNTLWEQKVDGQVFQMERLGDSLLITLYSRELLVLSMEDGKVQAQFELGEPYRLVRDSRDGLILCGKLGSWILESTPTLIKELTTPLPLD